MKLLYESSLLKTLADLLNNTSAQKTLQTTYELLNDGETYQKKITPIVDGIFTALSRLNKSVNSLSEFKELATQAAGKAAVKGVSKAIAAVIAELDSEFPVTSLFTDLTNFLTNADEDFASIKATYMQTSQTDEIYPERRSTLTLYNSAIETWFNAPRALNSTIFSAYSVVPVGIGEYLRSALKELLELRIAGNDQIMSPLLREVEKFKALLDESLEDMNTNAVRQNQIMIKSVALKRTPALVLASDSFNSSSKDYNYYFKIDSILGLKVLERLGTALDEDDRTFGVRFRLFEGLQEDPSGWLLPSQSTDLYYSPVSETRIFKLDSRFDNTKNIFLKNVVAQYETDSDEFHQYIKQNEVFMYAELVELLDQEDDGTYLEIRVKDVIPVTAYKTFNDVPVAGKTWYTVATIGGIFPDAADWRANIENYVEQLLSELIGLDTDLRIIAGEFSSMILNIMTRIINTFKAVIKLFITVARVLKFIDVRYIIFEGSYSDLPTAWRIVRNKFGIIEASDNLLFNLVATLKSKTISELATEALKTSLESSTTKYIRKTAEEPGLAFETTKKNELTDASVEVDLDRGPIQSEIEVITIGTLTNDIDEDISANATGDTVVGSDWEGTITFKGVRYGTPIMPYTDPL